MERKKTERRKLRVRSGDTVVVLAGKYRGKKGKVMKVDPIQGTVVVEGVNMIKKHQKPTQSMPQGGIIEREAPLPDSRVMTVCPRCNRPTRVGRKLLETGKSVRVCKKCGEVI